MTTSWLSRFFRGWTMPSAEPNTEANSESVTRRAFLRAGGLGAVSLSLADHAAWAELLRGDSRRNCILVLMTGGPSQLETFDPKPDAPTEIRGTLDAIATNVPGVYLSETLPNLSQRADRFSLVRSLHHSAAPIHETGLQLLQTGRLAWKGVRFPHIGQVLATANSESVGKPFEAIVPRSMQPITSGIFNGQEGFAEDPFVAEIGMLIAKEPEAIRRGYGHSEFGERLLHARLLIEQGVRCVTVNLHDGLRSCVTWDAHGDAECGPATIADCRDYLCPAFDVAMSGLIDDLSLRGLLDDTLIIAVGEMGRTPRINSNGGRDHWTKCWSALVAGGSTTGGQIIGASDEIAALPMDRPVELGEIPATLLHWFGVDSQTLTATVGKQELPLVPHAPIGELWGTASASSLTPELAAASA
jgi:uncharacterized protein (DUF1501 family)